MYRFASLIIPCMLFFGLWATAQPTLLLTRKASRMSGEGFEKAPGNHNGLFFIASSAIHAPGFSIDISFQEDARCLVARISNNKVPLWFELLNANEEQLKQWVFEQEYFAFHHQMEIAGGNYLWLKARTRDGREVCSYKIGRKKL